MRVLPRNLTEQHENGLLLAGVLAMFVVGAVISLLGWVAIRTPHLFAPYSAAVVGFFLLWLYKSIFSLGPNDGLETYLFGTHWVTYVSGSFWDSLPKYYGPSLRQRAEELVQNGHVSDYVFLPWPFWKVWRFPTSEVTLFQHTGKIYTDNAGDDAPQTMLAADPTMKFHFMSIRGLVTTLLTDWRFWGKSYIDLTSQCEVGKGDHKYTDSLLAKYLLESTSELIMEGVRKAAADYVFGVPTDDAHGKPELLRDKDSFEKVALWVFAEPGSNLRKSETLRRPTTHELDLDRDKPPRDINKKEFKEKLDDVTFDMFNGPYITERDFNIEGLNFDRLDPTASDAEKAINAAYVGLQTARASAMKIQREGVAKGDALAKEGVGRAKGLDALKATLGGDKVPPETLVLAEVLKGTPLNVNIVAPSIIEGAKALLGGHGKPSSPP